MEPERGRESQLLERGRESQLPESQLPERERDSQLRRSPRLMGEERERERRAAEMRRRIEEEEEAEYRAQVCRRLNVGNGEAAFASNSSTASPSSARNCMLEFEMDELKRKISRLEGEQRVERNAAREGDIDVMRYDLRRLMMKMW